MSSLNNSYGLTLEQSSYVFCNASTGQAFYQICPGVISCDFVLTSKAVKATVDGCMCYRQLVATPVLTFDLCARRPPCDQFGKYLTH